MSVEDHPVHPKTVRADGTLWGCNNAKRQPGYWAPDGKSPIGHTSGKRREYLAVEVWVEDTSSTNCHNAMRFDDPACADCKKLLT